MRRLVIEEPVSRAAIWGRRLALFSVPVFGAGVVLTRRGGAESSADLGAGLAVFGAGALIAACAFILGLAALAQIWREGRRGVGSAIQALLIAAVVLALPAFLAVRLLAMPYLADLTTDPVQPPGFSQTSAALAARHGLVPQPPAHNIPAGLLAAAPQLPEAEAETELGRTARELAGLLADNVRGWPLPLTETARLRDMQRRTHPEFTSLRTDLPPDQAFQRVKDAALAQGWTILDQTPPGGRFGLGHLDVVHETSLLRLPIDVTARLRTHAEGTIIDVRSVPRHRLFDIGTGPRSLDSFLSHVATGGSAAE